MWNIDQQTEGESVDVEYRSTNRRRVLNIDQQTEGERVLNIDQQTEGESVEYRSTNRRREC